MSEALAQAQPSSSELLLTVISGKDKGVAYKLLASTVHLGRAPENDVVLDDMKASRQHARIEQRSDGCFIVDLDSRTGVYVNTVKVKETELHDGDVIQVGEVALRYGTATFSVVHTAPPPPPTQSIANAKSKQWGFSPQPKPKPKSISTPQNKNPFMIIVVAGLIISGLILTQKQVTKHYKIKIKDDSLYDQQIEGTTEFNEKQEQAILSKGKDTQQYAEAQGFYLRGFREYRDSNFGRAIQDFEAALALYPNHPLAKRYLERSRLKNNELVTSALDRGEKDFQVEKYMNAFNEYRTVILLTNDPKNKNFQLAQKRIQAIELILTNNR